MDIDWDEFIQGTSIAISGFAISWLSAYAVNVLSNTLMFLLAPVGWALLYRGGRMIADSIGVSEQ